MTKEEFEMMKIYRNENSGVLKQAALNDKFEFLSAVLNLFAIELETYYSIEHVAWLYGVEVQEIIHAIGIESVVKCSDELNMIKGKDVIALCFALKNQSTIAREVSYQVLFVKGVLN